ncbi:hypothetical protein D3C84_879070 [compost metagenome]
MLIQQLLHLLGIFVVVHLLTRILLHQLAQAGELFHRLLVVTAIRLAKGAVLEEGGRLQRDFQAARKPTQCLVEVLTHLEVHIHQLAVHLFHLGHQHLAQLLDILLVLHPGEDTPQGLVELRQALVLGAHLVVETFEVVNVIAALGTGGEILILADSGIQLG